MKHFKIFRTLIYSDNLHLTDQKYDLHSSNRIDHNDVLSALKVNQKELCWMKNKQLVVLFRFFIKISTEKLLFLYKHLMENGDWHCSFWSLNFYSSLHSFFSPPKALVKLLIFAFQISHSIQEALDLPMRIKILQFLKNCSK